LHLKFEELYTDLQLKVDKVTERVLTLGDPSLHAYNDYLLTSSIKEQRNIANGKKATSSVIDSFGILLKLERELRNLSTDARDEKVIGITVAALI